MPLFLSWNHLEREFWVESELLKKVKPQKSGNSIILISSCFNLMAAIKVSSRQELPAQFNIIKKKIKENCMYINLIIM